MNFLLYATVSTEACQRVRDMLVTMLPGITVELYQTLNELGLRLQYRGDDAMVLLLLPESPDDILDLLTMRPLPRDVRILLVLPDLEEQTVALAHRLGPRHFTYVDNDFSGLATVIDSVFDS